MEIIPAIDLKEGKCVRLLRGEEAAETVYSGDPVAMARRWESLGARRLHIIDLDGAFSGMPKHLAVIRDVVRAVGLPIQVGGGLRSLDSITDCFDSGADRVILGTAVFSSSELVRATVERYPRRAWVSLDVRVGKVAIRGWKQTTSMDLIETARMLEDWGIGGLVYTDISRDGMLSGPNVGELQRLMRATALPVIASGGVGSMEHIRSLLKLDSRPVQGVIVGKALYDGAVDLRRALDLAAGV